MRLISWNVNGIRAAVKKDFFQSHQAMQPDILCLQETKAQDDQVMEALEPVNCSVYVNSAIKKGYSGTAVLTSIDPIDASLGIGEEAHDQEGRVITAEFKDFYLVTVYTPNSGSELKRLAYRQSWDLAFLDYIKDLEKVKPVIVCGDLNVAHTDIDLARPKQNYNKSAGYMQEEIDGLQRYLDAGFIDTFRFLNPDSIKYSWWSYRAGARQRNVGWRIDYFLVSQTLRSKLVSADVLSDVMGSDHCPVSLEIDVRA